MIPRVFNRLLARIRFNREFSRHQGVLWTTEEGLKLERFRLRDGAICLEPAWSFNWPDVRRIIGFKRDLFCVDMICLAFEVTDTMLEVNEEMEGFSILLNAIRLRFPDPDPSWWVTVALPPFATNLTTIWEKEQPSQDAVRQSVQLPG